MKIILRSPWNDLRETNVHEELYDETMLNETCCAREWTQGTKSKRNSNIYKRRLSSIIINCKQFIVSTLSVPRLHALRQCVTSTYTQLALNLKISSRSFRHALSFLFYDSLAICLYFHRFFDRFSATLNTQFDTDIFQSFEEKWVIMDFVGEWKKGTAREIEKRRVFTHLRHHRCASP